MEHVVVERWFEKPIEFDIRSTAAAALPCMSTHGVRYLRAYLAPNRQRLICVFEGPDAESVRIVNRQVGMPFEIVWTASVHLPAPADRSGSDRSGIAGAEVVVERVFPQPVHFDEIQGIEDRGAWCLEQNGVRFLQTYFSADRQRMICLYRAPDAEAVRRTNDQVGLPFERVWSATVVEP
jgi:hypothetical protein